MFEVKWHICLLYFENNSRLPLRELSFGYSYRNINNVKRDNEVWVERNIIGSLTRGDRHGDLFDITYDTHIQVKRTALRGTRSFPRISNNPGHICRLSWYPSLSPQWLPCDLYAGILAPRWRYIHSDGSVRLLVQSPLKSRLASCFAYSRYVLQSANYSELELSFIPSILCSSSDETTRRFLRWRNYVVS